MEPTGDERPAVLPTSSRGRRRDGKPAAKPRAGRPHRLNGGPEFTFDAAISFQVSCDSQEEIDELWTRLTDGGEESQCGWLKDRFGLSWQILPAALSEVLGDPDPERSQRAMKAMLGMKKLDIAELQRAAGAA